MISPDVILKLKELRIAQLCCKNGWTLAVLDLTANQHSQSRRYSLHLGRIGCAD